MDSQRDYLTVDDLSAEEREALRERVRYYKAIGRMGSRTLPPVTVRRFNLPLGVEKPKRHETGDSSGNE